MRRNSVKLARLRYANYINLVKTNGVLTLSISHENYFELDGDCYLKSDKVTVIDCGEMLGVISYPLDGVYYRSYTIGLVSIINRKRQLRRLMIKRPILVKPDKDFEIRQDFEKL